MKPERRLKAAEAAAQPQLAPPHKSAWQRFAGGLKRMANGEEKALTTIPWPVFTWLFAITIAAVYAFASLNATVQGMSNAMLMRDAQYAREREEDRKHDAEERQKLEAKLAEQTAYVNQMRVEMARKGGR